MTAFVSVLVPLLGHLFYSRTIFKSSLARLMSRIVSPRRTSVEFLPLHSAQGGRCDVASTGASRSAKARVSIIE